MATNPTEPQQEVSLRELYPELSEQELKEAEMNLARYFEIALEIRGERQASAGAVDIADAAPIIIEERSNCSQTI
jgi:hypothetical protein